MKNGEIIEILNSLSRIWTIYTNCTMWWPTNRMWSSSFDYNNK